jgi:hypothetical protein
MKPHRPWQPHMGSSPLFNPYSPAGRGTTLDHLDLVEDDQAVETDSSQTEPEQDADPTPPVKPD